LEKYERLCADRGVPPSHVALAWLLSRPAVASLVIGPVTMEQLDDSVASLEVQLDDGLLARLNDIFPGYRTAPEDYAW
jgi:aryl-alcohol dehydrogenase-like predicted oxidoreductase